MFKQMGDQFEVVSRKKVKVYSLVMITDRYKQRILLGFKKRGKLAENETIEQCAVREVLEECSLIINYGHLEKIGVMVYEFTNLDFLMEVHVFHTDRYTGNISESDEMRPTWFDINKVPFDQMWPDDKDWFPYFLRGNHFCGYFKLINDQTVSYKKIYLVDKEKEIKVAYA